MDRRTSRFIGACLLASFAFAVAPRVAEAIGFGEAKAAAKSVFNALLQNVGVGEMPVRQADGSFDGGTPASGDITSVSDVGDALSTANGTGPDPVITPHTTLENLVDTIVWASSGAYNWIAGLGAIVHITGPTDQNLVMASGGATRTIELRSNSTEIASVRSASFVADSYAGRVVVLADASLDFNDGAVQTLSISGDTTFTTTTSGLAAADARACQVYITTDGSTRNLTFPSAWKWLGTKPASQAGSSTGLLSLNSRGANESDIVACYTLLGSGS